MTENALSFGAAAEAYDAYRPSYPPAPPQRRSRSISAIRDLVAGLPDPFEVPYRTWTYRARRR